MWIKWGVQNVPLGNRVDCYLILILGNLEDRKCETADHWAA